MTARAPKVRIGLGLGTGNPLTAPEDLHRVVDAAEDLGFDSLWMSDRMTGTALDPVVALAVAAGRTRRLKLGTNVLILPGRDPFSVAKQFATLDRLSGGRLLPAIGLGAPARSDRVPFEVPRGTRATAFEEALSILRTLFAGERLPHPGGGSAYRLDPLPLRPPEIWFGGRSRKALERAGRLSDGWIGSFQTPSETAAAREVVAAAAVASGRTIDDDHYGTTLFYARDTRSEIAELVVRALSENYVPELSLPLGAEELAAAVTAHVAGGVTKFVLVPADRVTDWGVELSWLREVTAPLET